MFDTIKEIRAQLSAGEDSLAEFKELRIEQGAVTSPNPESFAGELVAFANADGGVVFLGVADSGVVQGIPDDAADLQQRGRSYVFDEQAVMTATLEDLDSSALARHFVAPPAIPQLDLWRNTKVVTRDESDVDRPTVAGLLAFGKEVQSHLPSAYIEAAVYVGTQLDSEYLNHSERIEGPVPQQIDRAMAFVDRFMLRPARKPSGRKDYPQYSNGTVHEAIVNAVAHRDYSLSGAKIRLYLFDDRMELYSPGSLPNTLTLESMPFRVFTRNQLLVSFLSKIRSGTTGLAFLESRGEGVRRILEEGERFSGRRPEYRLLDGQELLLTLWAAAPPR